MLFMRKTLLLIFLLFTFSYDNAYPSDSCPLTLRGKVLHEENNEPIAHAYIWLVELGQGAISDEKGNFRIDELCSGNYTIKVTYIGHQEEEKTVDITRNTNITFRMVAEDLLLEGVEIHGHRDAVITTSTISSLSGAALDESRGENLGETLKRIAGVTTFSTGTNIAKPVIHGLHSNRIMILNNGVKQEGQQWGAEHAPEIDPFMADEIAVVKGAETVRFGPEAMGGVIVVNPKPLPTTGGLSGTVNLVGASNGRSGSAAVELSGGSDKTKGLGYRIQSSGKYGGNVSSPRYYQSNTGIRELNFSGAAGYSSSRLGAELFYSRFESTIGILADAHTGNLSDLEAIIEHGSPFNKTDFSYDIFNPRQEVRHNLLKVKAHYHLPNASKLNFQYGFQHNQRQEFDKRRGDLNSKPALDLELLTHTVDLSYDHPAKKHWNGSVGLNFLQQVNNNIPGTGVTPLIPNYDMYNLGFFALEKYTRGHLELEAGLRYDYRYVDAARYDQNQQLVERDYTFNNFTAFLGGIYTFTPTITFSTNLGSAWRPPNINEQFSQGLHHGSASYEYGNPDFKSEQAYKWINTFSYAGDKLNVEFTGYVNHINNYIYLNPTEERFVSLRGTFNVFRYEQTDARLWGFDLSTHYKIHPQLEWYVRGSVVRAKDSNTGNYLPLIPADRMETGLTYRSNNWGVLKKNRLTLSHLAVAHQKRQPAFDFAPAPLGYHLWNLSFNTDIPLRQNTISAGIAVNNLLDLEYKDYMNRFRYFTHEMGRNVTLRLKYQF
jgi:iron complex outermembrane receptor protein